MKKLLWLAALLFASTAQSQVIAPVDRQAVQEVGESIARALNERDKRAVAELIDLRSLATRAARVLELGKADQDAYVRGVESVGGARLMEGLFRTLETSNGSARFMRLTDSRPVRALVRFDLGANGCDYLEYVVDASSGRPRIVDWFQLSSGQLISVTLGGIGQLFTTRDAGLLGRLLDIKSVDEEHMVRLRRIGELNRTGKYAEAVEQFHQLPEQIANARIMLTMRSQAASLGGMREEYDRTLATIAQKYSDDPATAFMLIDHYFNVKDYPKALSSIDIIEKRVGRDGVTTVLRAALHFASGDLANALKHADESIVLEPDRMQGYDTRASVLVGLGRHSDAVAAYRDMESRFDLKFTREIFTEDPTFEKFVASKEFRKWLPL